MRSSPLCIWHCMPHTSPQPSTTCRLPHPRPAPPRSAAKRRRCAADFTAMYGDLLSQAEPVMFDASRPRPVCWLPFLGCVYF